MEEVDRLGLPPERDSEEHNLENKKKLILLNTLSLANKKKTVGRPEGPNNKELDQSAFSGEDEISFNYPH